MSQLRYAALVPLCLFLSACSDDETSEPEPPAPPTIQAVTYNLGLALGFVNATEERAPLTIAEVAALDANLLCVQEVWSSDHVTQLQSATAASLGNTIFPSPQPETSGDPACGVDDQDEIETLRTCVEQNCADTCTDKLVDCVLAECVMELGAVPTQCQSCLQANVGQPMDDIIAACNSATAVYAYGGSFGIGLLTSFDIVTSEEHVFQSTTNRRAVVYAELDTPLGSVHAFCTHLTAGLSSVTYTGPYGSWEEEQAAQIAELITMVDDKAGADGLAIVMGDMNTGPAGENYIAEVPQNYQAFVDAGFQNPYVDRADEPCSFCRTNPLVDGAADESESVAIDHNLLRNIPGAASAERVLDQPIDISEYCGSPASFPPSDHYGIRTDIP